MSVSKWLSAVSDERRATLGTELMNHLRSIQREIDFYGRVVLEVGFGLGHNAWELANRGAVVFGVEPEKERFDWAVEHGKIDPGKAFNCVAQDVPVGNLPVIDLVTAFMWDIPRSEAAAVLHMMQRAVRPTGQVVIGMTNRSDFLALPEVAALYFRNGETLRGGPEYVPIHGNLRFLVLTEPLQLSTRSFRGWELSS